MPETKPITYQKLGSHRGMVAKPEALYLGDDHLLAIEGTSTEHYRRFFFRDICGVVIRPDSGGMITMIVVAIITGFVLFSGATAGDDLRPLLLGLGVFCGIILGILMIKGQTCTMTIYTAVQKRDIGAIRHRRKAEKVLRIISSAVEAAAGPVTEEDRARGIQTRGSLREQPPPLLTPAAQPTPAPAPADQDMAPTGTPRPEPLSPPQAANPAVETNPPPPSSPSNPQ